MQPIAITFTTLLLAALNAPTALAAEAAELTSPRHVGPPHVEHAATNRAFQGIPSLAVTVGGRLWATWYAGVTPGEDHNNYVALSTSGDGGATWREVLVIDPDGGGPVRAYDPELWVSPDGRLFVFWAQMDKGRRDSQHGVWCMETREFEVAQPKWSAPRRLADGVMMCKPLALSSGEWVLPVSLWRAHDDSAQMLVSGDLGKTWTRRGACNVPVADRGYDEHMFVERRDGSLWLLVRTKYGIGESVSTDHGKTWPELKPSAILHTASRFFIRRLASGNLLLVKHGPLDTKTGRSHLTAYISTDEGRQWGGGLLLDERTGVSYPDGQQSADGIIRIIYDYSRTGERHILMAAFREEDAAAGKAVSAAVRLRQLVSAGSGGQEKDRGAAKVVIPDVPGEALRRATPGTLTLAGGEAQALSAGVKLFNDREYLAAGLPEALKGAQFLRLAMNGDKVVVCQRAGTVWMLTPAPERNRDSQAKALTGQGFAKVALAEIPLFGPKTAANLCTLYQKECVAGEKLRVGKWAVPVFLP